MKEKIKARIGVKNYRKLVKIYFYFNNRRLLISNFITDYKLFKKYSCCFVDNSYEAIESQIILNYHSIEKGFLFKKVKPRFAQNRVENLHYYLGKKLSLDNAKSSQFAQAYNVMCKYYELHDRLGIDIKDYYSKAQYSRYKDILSNDLIENNGTVKYLNQSYFKDVENNNFASFSESRRSVRDFTGDLIEIEKIKNAIELALNAPSVCNRQASSVYYISDKSVIDEIMKIQGGFTGYTKNIKQLLIITTDISFFYTVGERNQFYIDGGIFLMNLLYSLHYFRIGNCPANWGKTMKDDKKIRKLVNIPWKDKIICCLPIGIVHDDVEVCYSKRRVVSEVFKEV